MQNNDEKKDHGEIIIVRRSHDDHDDHHGGVWKIAFADFMTAMMAFFLVMWLINASNEETKKAVASYFNPIKLMDRRSNPKGVRNPKYGTSTKNEKAPDDETTVITSPTAAPISGKGVAETFDEQALFSDPYALLVEIAAGVDQENDEAKNLDPSQTSNTVGMGLSGGVAFQDPFDPRAWSLNFGNQPPMDIETAPNPEDTTSSRFSSKQKSMPNNDGAANISEPIKAIEDKSNTLADEIRQEAKMLEKQNGSGVPKIKITSKGNGTLITLFDQTDAGMFKIGSARPSQKMVQIMTRIGKILSKKTGKITIAGHTDGRKYQSKQYDNWRLSTARAHMAYHMLIRGGLNEQRIELIKGHADAKLANPNKPYAAVNRRIELFLRPQ